MAETNPSYSAQELEAFRQAGLAKIDAALAGFARVAEDARFDGRQGRYAKRRKQLEDLRDELAPPEAAPAADQPEPEEA